MSSVTSPCARASPAGLRDCSSSRPFSQLSPPLGVGGRYCFAPQERGLLRSVQTGQVHGTVRRTASSYSCLYLEHCTSLHRSPSAHSNSFSRAARIQVRPHTQTHTHQLTQASDPISFLWPPPANGRRSLAQAVCIHAYYRQSLDPLQQKRAAWPR